MYEKLLFPTIIKDRNITNRVVASPPPSFLCEKDGSLSSQFFNYYQELSKSKPGILILEDCAISEQGKAWHNQPLISDKLNFTTISELVIKIRNHDILPMIQLYHGGINSLPDKNHNVYGPSFFENKKIIGKVQSLSLKEIDSIVNDYKKAASLVWNAGFSGIQLNAADGSLLHQFLSPKLNKRTDEYSFKKNNGILLLIRVIEAIKSVASDLIFSLKLCIRDLIPGGSGLSAAIDIANTCKEFGVDLFYLTEGLKIGNPYCLHPYFVGNTVPAPICDEALIFKNETNTKVILSAGILTPQNAERLLEKSFCDYISLGRVLNREPKWITMALTNQPVEFYKKCNNCLFCKAAKEGCINLKSNKLKAYE